MIFNEEHRDLFTVPEDYHLAHCISADFGMGAGIAVEFNKRFDMKNRLIEMFDGNVTHAWDENGKDKDSQGVCFKVDRVLNLVTKRNYWLKPTYKTLTEALISMREICVEYNITKIAMPVIGCGLDRLKWNKVSEIIKEVFADTDIEFLVCIK